MNLEGVKGKEAEVGHVTPYALQAWFHVKMSFH
jgi:hypothetical protein